MSGTSQDPLWTEPPWTSFFPVGTKVRSTYTDNTGEVVAVDPFGHRLTIAWGPSYRDPDGHKCFHSSELGLERVP